MPHQECRPGAHLPSLDCDKPLKYVTHGQCDVRPSATFPAAGHCRPCRYQNFACDIKYTEYESPDGALWHRGNYGVVSN